MSSLDEILCCCYSNEIVLTELLNITLHFVGFYKRQSAIFVFFSSATSRNERVDTHS